MKLKPCPVCGEQPIISVLTHTKMSFHCRSGHMEGPIRCLKVEAEEAWNAAVDAYEPKQDETESKMRQDEEEARSDADEWIGVAAGKDKFVAASVSKGVAHVGERSEFDEVMAPLREDQPDAPWADVEYGNKQFTFTKKQLEIMRECGDPIYERIKDLAEFSDTLEEKANHHLVKKCERDKAQREISEIPGNEEIPSEELQKLIADVVTAAEACRYGWVSAVQPKCDALVDAMVSAGIMKHPDCGGCEPMKDIDELRKNLDDAHQERDAARRDLHSAQKRAAEMRMGRDALADDLDVAMLTIKRLRKERDGFREELKGCMEQRDEWRAEAKEEISRLHEDRVNSVKKVTKERDEALEKIKQLRGNIREVSNRIVGLDADREAAIGILSVDMGKHEHATSLLGYARALRGRYDSIKTYDVSKNYDLLKIANLMGLRSSGEALEGVKKLARRIDEAKWILESAELAADGSHIPNPHIIHPTIVKIVNLKSRCDKLRHDLDNLSEQVRNLATVADV